MSDVYAEGQVTGTVYGSGRVAGQLGVSSIILNDWTITLEEITGGHRLTATRGSSTQSMDIMDGKKTVREVLKAADPELKIVDFKRFTLRAE